MDSRLFIHVLVNFYFNNAELLPTTNVYFVHGTAGLGTWLQFGCKWDPVFLHSGLASSLEQLICMAECESARAEPNHATHLKPCPTMYSPSTGQS